MKESMMPSPEQLKKIQDENMNEAQIKQSNEREETLNRGFDAGKEFGIKRKFLTKQDFTECVGGQKFKLVYLNDMSDEILEHEADFGGFVDDDVLVMRDDQFDDDVKTVVHLNKVISIKNAKTGDTRWGADDMDYQKFIEIEKNK